MHVLIWFETMIWPRIRLDISLQNFQKPLDIFSPQIERKRSKEYLIIILVVRESFERFSCLEFIFQKSKYREAGLKHKLKLFLSRRLRIFRDTLILVFVNEIYCLCICFTVLIVGGLSCNFIRCAVCFQSFSEHRLQEYSKCRAYQTLLKITHR